MKNQKQSARLRRMVAIAMFTAMAYVAMLVLHIKVGFLTMDVKDAVITLCGLYFGPVAAVLIAVLVPVLELFTISETGIYGLIMNILGSAVFAATVALIYKWKRTLWGAVAGLVSGVLLMSAVMVVANLLITPYFMGVTADVVRGMIPGLLLPFNLLKGVINAGAVLFLYKPLSRVLRRTGFLPCRAAATPADGAKAPLTPQKKVLTGVLVSVTALVLIAVSAVLIFAVLGGRLDFGI